MIMDCIFFTGVSDVLASIYSQNDTVVRQAQTRSLLLQSISALNATVNQYQQEILVLQQHRLQSTKPIMIDMQTNVSPLQDSILSLNTTNNQQQQQISIL